VHEGTNRYGNRFKTEQKRTQTDLNLEYKVDHVDFLSTDFTITSTITSYLSTGEIIDENAVFDYIQDNAVIWMGEIGLHFHPHPLDWLHFETSFENRNGQKTR
jgi:iron complex outermembrane receptor protein